MPRLAKRQPAISLEATAFETLDDYINRVAFSSDGMMLAACSASGQVSVWEVPSLKPVCGLKGHEQSALTLAWHPTRNEMATGGQDGVVRLWLPGTGEERAVLPVGTGGTWVEHLAWSPDGKFLAASAGRILRIWNCEGGATPQLAGEVPAHKTTISALTWMPRDEASLPPAMAGPGSGESERRSRCARFPTTARSCPSRSVQAGSISRRGILMGPCICSGPTRNRTGTCQAIQ